MPCNDVTEQIEVVLDGAERLKGYHFAKRTCGQPIGSESMLLEQLSGRTLDELLYKTAEEFLTEFPQDDEVEEFLNMKHLFAIQSVLEVYTGIEPGGPQSLFAPAEITYSEDEIVIFGRLSVDLMAEKIESCGGCKLCGSDDVTKAKAAQKVVRKALRDSSLI